jgi:hypothetical protein
MMKEGKKLKLVFYNNNNNMFNMFKSKINKPSPPKNHHNIYNHKFKL